MHPSGINFGLSQALLELSGDDVVVSGPFRERISEIARRWVRRRKRVFYIWKFVVTEALQDMPYTLTVRGNETTCPSIRASTAPCSRR